ncbi:MAG: hypothetical protein AVDCRST_MAG68-5016, partial [uncultured Gemmatimonadetes bacterium]
ESTPGPVRRSHGAEPRSGEPRGHQRPARAGGGAPRGAAHLGALPLLRAPLRRARAAVRAQRQRLARHPVRPPHLHRGGAGEVAGGGPVVARDAAVDAGGAPGDAARGAGARHPRVARPLRHPAGGRRGAAGDARDALPPGALPAARRRLRRAGRPRPGPPAPRHGRHPGLRRRRRAGGDRAGRPRPHRLGAGPRPFPRRVDRRRPRDARGGTGGTAM